MRTVCQCKYERLTDRQTGTQSVSICKYDRQTGRDRQMDRQTDQTDRQTDMGTISIRKSTGNATFLSTPLKKERRRNDNLKRKR